MEPRYPRFQIEKIQLHDHADIDAYLRDRGIKELTPCGTSTNSNREDELHWLTEAVKRAKRLERPIVLFMGAHPIKLGLTGYINDLITKGFITHVATTGAGLIHDWQLAKHGKTDENVPAQLAKGRFGFWKELEQLNEQVQITSRACCGLGEGTGCCLCRQMHDHVPMLSINGNCYRENRPFTVHVGIGTDIVAMYPGYEASAWGHTSGIDFLVFAEAIRNIQNGVFINMASAVAGPEVFLKALSMSINTGSTPTGLTTAVFDFGPEWVHAKAQRLRRIDPEYYNRAWKTLLQRTPAIDKNSMHACMVAGDLTYTLPRFWTMLTKALD